MGVVIWPKVFTDSDFKYPVMDLEDNMRVAGADGLTGWATVLCGNKPPENFGHGMVKISKILGIPATAEHLTDFAKKKGWIE